MLVNLPFVLTSKLVFIATGGLKISVRVIANQCVTSKFNDFIVFIPMRLRAMGN